MAELPADHPLWGPEGLAQLRDRLDAISTVGPRSAAMVDVASRTRALIEALTSTTASADAIAEVADLVAKAVGLLAAEGSGRAYTGPAEASLAAGETSALDPDDPDRPGFLHFSPLFGRANPLAPPLEPKLEGEHVTAEAVFGSAYEGPPGCLHGGFIAAAFDEVLGLVQALTGQPGMTGRLEVKYRNPTPLHAPLMFRAWVERVEGRKILTRATCSADGVLTAEAEGLFITIDESKFGSLLQRRTTH